MTPPNTTAAGERLLTRYLVFETADEGKTLKFAGIQDADNSDSALRKFYEHPDRPAPAAPHVAAVSENNFKLRPGAIETKFRLGAARDWPAEDGAPEPPAEETLPV